MPGQEVSRVCGDDVVGFANDMPLFGPKDQYIVAFTMRGSDVAFTMSADAMKWSPPSANDRRRSQVLIEEEGFWRRTQLPADRWPVAVRAIEASPERFDLPGLQLLPDEKVRTIVSFLLEMVLAVIIGAVISLWLLYLSKDLVAAYCAVRRNDSSDASS